MTRAVFVVTFACPADGAEVRRLRGLLKTALRTFGLRCVRVAPAVGDEETP